MYCLSIEIESAYIWMRLLHSGTSLLWVMKLISVTILRGYSTVVYYDLITVRLVLLYSVVVPTYTQVSQKWKSV